jgi:hypothetical protein
LISDERRLACNTGDHVWVGEREVVIAGKDHSELGFVDRCNASRDKDFVSQVGEQLDCVINNENVTGLNRMHKSTRGIGLGLSRKKGVRDYHDGQGNGQVAPPTQSGFGVLCILTDTLGRIAGARQA